VTVANMNWQSAEVLAQIDAASGCHLILSKGYGCEVELVPGDTMPTLTAMMEKGQPDVAPEAWINAVRQPLDAAVKEGQTALRRPLADRRRRGRLVDPKIRGRRPPGHQNHRRRAGARSCSLRLKTRQGRGAQLPLGLELPDHHRQRLQGLGRGRQGLPAAGHRLGRRPGRLDRQGLRTPEGWLGYYWAPTSILGKYDMVKLDAGVPHDKEAFEACNSQGRMRQSGEDRLGARRGVHRHHRPLPESRRPAVTT
jgi:glycine betaine/proline transport system substrate-binding protein